MIVIIDISDKLISTITIIYDINRIDSGETSSYTSSDNEDIPIIDPRPIDIINVEHNISEVYDSINLNASAPIRHTFHFPMIISFKSMTEFEGG